jgi:hypothetical protein
MVMSPCAVRMGHYLHKQEYSRSVGDRTAHLRALPHAEPIMAVGNDSCVRSSQRRDR